MVKAVSMKIYCMNIEELPQKREALMKELAQRVPLIYPMIAEKMKRLKNDADRKRSLSAYLLLLYAYCMEEKQKAQRNMAELSISCDIGGKPYFHGEKQPFFNLSHSGTYAVCAFDNALACGVDIQEIREMKPSFTDRFFSQKECELVAGQVSISEQGKNRICTEIWSKKESLGKCIGCGLAGKMEELDTESTDYHVGVLPLHGEDQYVLTYCSRLQVCPEIKQVSYAEVLKEVFI